MPAAADTKNQTTRGTLYQLIPSGLILFCGAVVTIYLYFNAIENEDKTAARRFDYAIQLHKELLTQTINRKVSALRSIQTLFTFSDEVTQKEFEGAARLALKEGIPGVEWVPIIQHADRAAFEARARSYGFEDYSIRDFAPGYQLVPADEQDEYYPILFIYPLEERVAMLGLNVKTLTTGQELEYAIQTREPVASVKTELVQRQPRPDSWIISIPVYDAESFLNEMTASHMQLPRGFLQALLNLDDLFEEAWGHLSSDHLHVSVTDITDKTNTVALWKDIHLDQEKAQFNALNRTETFFALQREWQLLFFDTAELRAKSSSKAPFNTLITGTILTCLLAAFIYHVLHLRYEVELQVQERTHDLRIANQQLNEEISERRKSEEARTQLEEQLRHSQKMEAIGTLAGGIAHDFNNILAAVLGYIELVRDEVSDRKDVAANISELEKACYRARDLVRQILTFSRQEEEQRQIIRPAPIIQEVVKLTRATKPVNVSIKTEVDEDVWSIEADPTQIHQIALNLITNASHAIGQKPGKIEVALRGIAFDAPEETLEGEIPPGRYVCLVVKDNGCGMPPETVSRIFEPYFTTKLTGQGTGMGLSMVHGIVRSHGGYISVHSTPGMGTRFDIYFLARISEPVIIPVSRDHLKLGTQQHIVVVDDEEPITSLIEIHLKKHGYLVKTFSDSIKCLQYLRTTQDSLDLLITDSAMPGISGMEIIMEMRKCHPQLPIILYSGRIHQHDLEEFEALGVDAILRKPVSFAEMQETVTQLLKH